MANTPDNNQDEIKIEIPDVLKLMQQPDADFAIMAARMMSHYEMSKNKMMFNMSSGGVPDLIITPIDGKKSAYLYSKTEEKFIAAGILVKSEFDKTGKVSPRRREKYLIELTKDVLRNYDALAKNSQDYSDLRIQVMAQTVAQLESIGSLTVREYADSVRDAAKENLIRGMKSSDPFFLQEASANFDRIYDAALAHVEKASKRITMQEFYPPMLGAVLEKMGFKIVQEPKPQEPVTFDYNVTYNNAATAVPAANDITPATPVTKPAAKQPAIK